MNGKTVLVSGGGIAGSTLAYWLARNGFTPTVLERSRGLRSSGAPVDVRGEAITVAEEMGVFDQVRSAATTATAMTFVDDDGRRTGRVNTAALYRATGRKDVELPRGELAAILSKATAEHAEVQLGDSVATLRQDEHGVDVTFESGDERRFDLVIGADGLHSAVRAATFGPEHQFVEHMGLYLATFPFDGELGRPNDVELYNTPGRLVALHPSVNGALAGFFFRRDAVPGLDHRDTAWHKRLVAEAFDGAAWRVPELLERMATTDDLYFDAVSKVQLPRWSDGRIGLVGDAASCVSLFGDGSSSAMAGAHLLATTLAANPADLARGFADYEREHRKVTDPKQRNSGSASSLIVPATRTGIAARNLASRLWPLAAAGGWLRKLVA